MSSEDTQTPRATSPWRVIEPQNHPSYTCSGSRKRARLTTPRCNPSSSVLHESNTASNSSDLDKSRIDIPSPSPLVNEKYYLADGCDTPTAARDAYFDREEFDAQHYRMGRFAGRYNHAPETPAIGTRPRRIHHRGQESQDTQGWGSSIVGMVGGVINFCWTKTFRGFYAGPGRGYDIGSPIEQKSWVEIPPAEDVFHSRYERHRSPVPGQFPEESFIHDYMSHPEAYQAEELLTPVRYDERESERDSHATEAYGLPSEWSPNRANRKVPRAAVCSKPRSRASVAGRPKLAPNRPSMALGAGSPAVDAGHGASYASPRGSLRGLDSGARRSYIREPQGVSSATSASLSTPSPEVVKFEKRIKSQKKKENASIHRMNQKLEDLIRGGTEALGSKVEVEDVSMEDEGYES